MGSRADSMMGTTQGGSEKFESNFEAIGEDGEESASQQLAGAGAPPSGGASNQPIDPKPDLKARAPDRRLGSLEASDDLSVGQECFVGAFLLLLMFVVYLFTRRVTAPKAFESNRTRIVRKKAPTFVQKLL